MKLTVIVLCFLLTACGFSKLEPKLEIVDYDQLKSTIQKDDDKLYVVNFWATWCVPCVEELPHFMEVNEQFTANNQYQMILVSLDKADQVSTGIPKLLEKLNITTDVYLLNDNKRMNEWIPAIDSTWSGAIPATILYKNGKKLSFTEGQLSKDELQELINKHL